MRWLVPTLLSVLALGALGVTSTLALRTLRWPDLILWTGATYACVVPMLLLLGRTGIRVAPGTGWAVLSAVLAVSGLIALYVALQRGHPTSVVPVSATYPAVTMILAAIVFSEGVSVAKITGTALVIGGVVLITMTP